MGAQDVKNRLAMKEDFTIATVLSAMMLVCLIGLVYLIHELSKILQ